MKIKCPYCGESIEITTGHPPRLNIPVTTLCDTLAHSNNILVAASNLKCSRAYIYRELKKIGKTPKDYLKVG